MPPQTSRYPTPAAGDAPGGRHRRPESLADVAPVPRTSATSAIPAPRRSRHQRTIRPGRHSRVRTTTRPPVTGSHRAPGTLPIESWLLMGKTRQQVLLASLVAIGLLLVAIPADHRRSGVDAVNAAAQRAVGAAAPAKKQATAPIGAGGAAADDHESEPEPTRPAKPTPSPSASSATAAPGKPPAVKPTTTPPKPVVNDLGPGHSLRTTGSRVIALTFDDGPDPVQTPRILALLDEHQVKATFCLVGEQARKHPEIVRQIAAAGHTLCNHTWNHSLTIGKDKPEQIRADLQRTNEAILAAVPGAKIPFFRAPGGNFSERLVSVAGEAGMTSLYWQVDPADWDHPKGESSAAHVNRVIADVQKHVRPGAIVLSHDFNQPDTIEAYEKLIPWLKERFTIGMPGEALPPASPPATATPSAPPQA